MTVFTMLASWAIAIASWANYIVLSLSVIKLHARI